MARQALQLLALACALGGAAASLKAARSEACLRVQNNASLPVLLVSSCTTNHTLEAGGALTLNVSGLETFWVVPYGAYWDCDHGCAECFYVRVRALPSGEAASIVGFGGGTDGADANRTARSNETWKEPEQTHSSVHAQLDGNTSGMNITAVHLYGTPPKSPGDARGTAALGDGDANATMIANRSECMSLVIEGPRVEQPIFLWGGIWPRWTPRRPGYWPLPGVPYWRPWCRWYCVVGYCWRSCW